MSTATSIASMAQQLSRGFGISIVALLRICRSSGAVRPCSIIPISLSRFPAHVDGAVLPRLFLVVAHDAAVEVSRPPAEDSRIAAHALAAPCRQSVRFYNDAGRRR